MKKIIVCIIITLFVVTNVPLGFASSNPSNNEQVGIDDPIDQFETPIPGCLKDGVLDLISNYNIPLTQFDYGKTPSAYNNDLVSLIQLIDEETYLEYLEGLVSFGPRVTTTDECLDAGEYIYNEFVEMGIDARIQEWDDGSLFGTNIEGTIHGIDPLSDEIYIICAHYDSVPGSPGADDDASGVAAVMTAAKIMSSFSFNHTVKFVAFSGEEQGLYGSYHYVDEAYLNDDNIVAALNADMIGFALTEEEASYIRVFEDESSEWLAEYTNDISQEYDDVIDLEVLYAGYTYGSDHYRFWQAGYNAIFYAEYNFNDYYHSSEDTIENMDISYATKVSKLIIATLGDLSEIQIATIPFKPNPPIGPSSGKINEEYTYSASTIDPNGDDLFYQFDWGDGQLSDWIGPISSGETAEGSYTWSSQGDFEIRVKAKDSNDLESPWSNPLSVSMPKSFNRFNNLQIQELIYLILQILRSN